jgi:hypothetical protein
MQPRHRWLIAGSVVATIMSWLLGLAVLVGYSLRQVDRIEAALEAAGIEILTSRREATQS